MRGQYAIHILEELVEEGGRHVSSEFQFWGHGYGKKKPQ